MKSHFVNISCLNNAAGEKKRSSMKVASPGEGKIELVKKYTLIWF